MTRPALHRDLHLWLAITFAAVVLLGRSWIITSAQSERIDDEYHIQRGVMFLNRTLANQVKFKLNDPPLGEALGILPLWLAGNWSHHQANSTSYIWGERFSADTTLNLIGLWKSLLLVPVVGLIFHWIRKLFGTAAAWLAVGLVLIEPTIAAHTPLPSLDVLGMEGIVVAAYLLWRYFERPGIRRIVTATIATAIALLLKHTAIVLPAVAVWFAALWWVVKPWRESRLNASWRGQISSRLRDSTIAIGLGAFSIWSLLMFDVSRVFPPPLEVTPFRRIYPVIGDITQVRLPAGLYICSILQAKWHDDRGHPGYLLGKKINKGWWYYFPVVSTYKVPIGLGILIVAGLFSVFWLTPKWDEWGLFVPMILLVALMLFSSINIGWRHFMPAELFMMLAASRLLRGKVADSGSSPLYSGKKSSSARLPEHSGSSPQYSGERLGEGLFPTVGDRANGPSPSLSPGYGGEEPAFRIPNRATVIATWALVAVAWVDTLCYHPDYISYITFPRQQGWRAISDSNVDWGQGLKYVKKWIKSQGGRLANRKIYLCDYAWGPNTAYLRGRLGDRVEVLTRSPSLPGRGVVIISTVDVMGMYETYDWYKVLRKYKPVAELGHAMLVYDLDKLRPKGMPFDWGPQPGAPKAKRRPVKPASRPAASATSILETSL